MALADYRSQNSGYETAEVMQPAPPSPVSADGGDQQAYNTDGKQFPSPAYPAPSQPAYPAPSQPAYPAPSRPAYPAPSQPAYPAPSQPSYPSPPSPSYPKSPQPNPTVPSTYTGQSKPSYPAPSQPAYPGSAQPTNEFPMVALDEKEGDNSRCYRTQGSDLQR
ncbi:hypothetical protein OSTOST_21890 [Ostertagia ostertagi]